MLYRMSQEPLQSFVASCAQLASVLEEKYTVTTRDSAIKRFEMTVELAWKTLQKKLAEEGVVCRSPRGCFEEAFKLDIVQDDPVWLDMLDTRNLTVHTYDEKCAKKVYKKLRKYEKALRMLAMRIDGR